MTRFARTPCSCIAEPARAAGMAHDGLAFLCSQPAVRDAAATARNVLTSSTVEDTTTWVLWAYNETRKVVPLPYVPNSAFASVFKAAEAMFTLCEQPRSAGWRGDTVRVLADAIEVVDRFAVGIHTVSLVVFAPSGLLAEGVGVVVTGSIAAVVSTVVATCQGLAAAGIPEELRRFAAQLDAEDAAATPAPYRPRTDRFRGSDLDAIGLPGRESTTTEGGGGAAVLGVGGLAILFALAKAAL